jgi:hypothetical protein
MKWPHHRNLLNRPPTPSKGRWIEAVDRDIHQAGFLKSDPQRGRDERVVVRSHRIAT